MIIELIDLTNLDIKGPKGDAYKGVLPRRMKYLEPVAAECFVEMIRKYPGMAFSDMYRDPIASLQARRTKAGVQRPGYSGHNYGISFDCDVDQTCKNLNVRYNELISILKDYGWTCHRSDGKRGPEDWHFNCIGEYAKLPGAKGVQKWIENEHPMYCSPTITIKGNAKMIQEMLTKLRLYGGEIDGKLGPLSEAALNSFKKAYDLTGPSVTEAMVVRTLAIATAQKEIVSTAY